MRSTYLIALPLLLVSWTTIAGADLAAPSSRPMVHQAAAFDVSPPLREMAKLPLPPRYNFHIQEAPRSLPISATREARIADPVEQTTAGVPLSVTIGVNVMGTPDFDMNGSATDQNLAVGDTQVVEWINSPYEIFDKNTGAVIAGPFDGGTLWAGFDGACGNYQYPGDIIVQWDAHNHRWIFGYNLTTPPYYVCVAVSTTSDATGSYYRYQYSLAPGIELPDYQKWGIWPDGYYQTSNNYHGLIFTGSYPCAYNSAKMVVGDPSAEQICFQLSPSDFGLLPGDLDSSTPPPAGQDEFFIGGFFQGANNNTLYLYSMHPDFANPSQSTITGSNASQPITVATFEMTCDGVRYDTTPCVPQLNGELLRALGSRLMYRFAYTDDQPLGHVGPTAGQVPRQHWVVSHSVETSGGQAGMRWYEFVAPQHVVPATALTLFQQGTYAPDSNWRWMGSIARDKVGDILMAYSISSSSMYPAIVFTGRVPGDPLGTMEGEQTIYAGTGAQINSYGGWGDYSAARLDPSDGCTFWYVNEYYVATGMVYSTRLASIKFNNCH